MDWFWWVYLVLVGGGLLGALYFVMTAWRGLIRKFTLESWDAGGWLVALVIAFGLVLYNFYDLRIYDTPHPDTVFRMFQVIFLYTLIDVVIVTRLIMWKKIRSANGKRRQDEEEMR